MKEQQPKIDLSMLSDKDKEELAKRKADGLGMLPTSMVDVDILTLDAYTEFMRLAQEGKNDC